MRLLAGFAAFVLALSATTRPAGAGSPAPAVVVTERDNGHAIVLRPDQRLEIRLPANATTGYSWQAAGLRGPALAETAKPQYLAPSSNLAGAGGVQTFSYTARTPGSERLSFSYQRPWEKVQPSRTFALSVTVKG
jgi:inhibitor of cysteine peptidase